MWGAYYLVLIINGAPAGPILLPSWTDCIIEKAAITRQLSDADVQGTCVPAGFGE